MATTLPLLVAEQSTRQILSAMLLVAGIVVIAILLTMQVRNRIVRRQAARPSAREQIEQVKAIPQRQAMRERQSSQTADVEHVRQFAAQLDNKAERLEQLLREAEIRIEELQRILPHAAPKGDKNPPDARRDGFQRPEETDDPLTRSVYELADAGHNPIEIAQQLDEQVGKIDLILALRGK